MVTTEALLEIAAAATSGLFVGGALYTSVVQQPAFLECATTNEFRAPYFSRAYAHAARLQSRLSIVSSVSAIAAGILLRESDSTNSKLWLASGSLMLTIIPYTIVRMLKLNFQLIDTANCIKQGDKWMEENFRRWGQLHHVRTGISMVAFTGMLVALSDSFPVEKTIVVT
ncbi:hypothetical protein Poli38472_006787 [Pythium oligandrum]|uniref:DUF1772-domain-containing protein n=1 Tax=Pythium oligandrum TaxID=41045 RepID=A0A8K1FEL6_PYTOL|nr:hypothetical protein Poli38472_006787 [Pythium oligandrum]|eukprot:TMW56777.1 hypothetical protein Poli38472_006787 [Pythium oligandrum]